MNIITLDNKLTFAEMTKIYNYVSTSLFQIGFSDDDVFENQSTKYLHSAYSIEEYNENIDMPRIINRTPELQANLIGYKPYRVTINLSVPTEYHHPHIHGKDDKILLYYVNTKWDISWEGETLFYNDDLTEVEYTSMYKPGRIVLFDGNIPHTLRSQTIHAPMYRFTLSVFHHKL